MPGQDDYVTKPFGMKELLARIRAALRRTTARWQRPHIFASDDLDVDFDARRVRVKGKAVRLTPKEFDLLRYLVSHAGRPVSHRELLQAVWGPGITATRRRTCACLSPTCERRSSRILQSRRTS